MLWPEAKAYSAQRQKAALFRDKTEALLKQGYVELSGEDAVNFLVGNTILIKKTDTPKGIATAATDRGYYIADRHTTYECSGNDCSTQSWKVDGQEICIESPEQCDDSAYKVYDAPRLFKAPRPDKRTGRIGIYLTFKSIVHDVVEGNKTIAPLIDPGGVGKIMEVNSAEFLKEIETHDNSVPVGERLRRSALHQTERPQDDKVLIEGPRAFSLLVGNTYISGETVTDEHGIHLCPDEGYYYSPDGRMISFNCHHEPDWPESWSMHLTHWKLASGRLCFEDLSGNGEFGCNDGMGLVHLTPSGHPDEWLAVKQEIPRRLVGHSGNIFNFK
jgi:hypothetical protein